MTSRVPILVTILGATGTGKSKLAIELAQRYIGEIISADSMQVYKGLDIITAKVTKDEQSMAPHHMLDIVDPLSTFTVVDFRNRALPIIENLTSNKKMPIIVGGTNYYIESLLWQVLIDDQNYDDNNDDEDKNISNANNSLIFERDFGYVKLTNDSKKLLKSEKLDDLNQVPPFKKIKFDDPITNVELHAKLKEIDPESADRLHPNNRRKIMRSLQVFEQLGTKQSDILREQRIAGGSGLGGPLRFDNSIILWLQCDREILDERLDKRVDSMIESGLVQELLDFHETYNHHRIKSNEVPDYTKGIFQSIGFKEFHDYLVLDEEDKNSEKGKKLFQTGIENLKLRTRRYARRQHKWVTNRLIKRSDRQVPPVYSLDTTDLSKWKDNVFEAAVSIIDEKMSGQIPTRKCLNNYNYCHNDDKKEKDKTENQLLLNSQKSNEQSHFCETCERIFVGQLQWKAHLDGKKHERVAKRVKLKKLKQQQQQEQQQQ